MNAFAIRCYGQRWLALTPNPPEGIETARNYGWRPFRWVRDPIDAEKFGSREAAQLFVNGLKGDGYEIVALMPGGRGLVA